MKKSLLFLLLLAFSLYFGQIKEFPLKNEDFSAILLNKEMYFEGKISKETPAKVKFENIIKSPEKPNVYFVSGFSDIEGNQAHFLGELIFTEKYDVKNEPAQMLLFGDFYLLEKRKGEHSGMFKGKFRIQTGKDQDKVQKEGFSTITFRGKWKNYSGTLDFEVWWANFQPKDISKVIFK